jgi:hypothetical protein
MCNLPRPWPAFLADVDQSLSEPVELHCLGGFVLTAVYGIPRSTADIDYIAIIPQEAIEDLERIAGRDSALAKKQVDSGLQVTPSSADFYHAAARSMLDGRDVRRDASPTRFMNW